MELRWAWWWAWWACVVVVVKGDWEDCPPGCKCTYNSNRKLSLCPHLYPSLTAVLPPHTHTQLADCSAKEFSTVPSSLSTEIQELILSSNDITYLGKDAFHKTGMVNLQKLYLHDNRVRTMHKDAFRGLTIMIELDLSNNRIDKLHPGTFTGLEKLRVLDLSMNLLSRLNGVQFPPLPHLRRLSFRENRLTYIHNYAFSNLHILESLRLSGNQLKLLQPELFTNNTKLGELELHDNLWECDCHLKALVSWTRRKQLLQTHVTCHGPERMSKLNLNDVPDEDLACRPEVVVPQLEVPAAPGQNATLTCRVRGDPVPRVRWVLNGRVLTNLSVVRFSAPEQIYLVKEELGSLPGERVTSLTVTYVSEDDLTYYTCVAENKAGLVERNVSLVTAAPSITGAITPLAGPDWYLIIGVVVGGVLLLLLVCICVCVCVRRRRRRTPKPKVNGTAGSSHIRHENVMIVNPVEKPPRKYEKVPQTDLEMTGMAGRVSGGEHRSYDEVDYPPEAAPPGLRTPLATLEEEEDDLPHHNTTMDASVVPADYWNQYQYPDLVDMTRPRATSPPAMPHLPYRSPAGLGEWRYSYAHPAHYPIPSDYHTGYTSPPGTSRPGYVTLPRRHRSPSWAGPSTTEVASPPPAPASECGDVRVPYDPIYDTLGPRTTADGTSRTDLTRVALRFEPRTPLSSTTSPPSSLPPNYAALPTYPSSAPHAQPKSRLHSTLPRSTPNLLEGSGLSGLSLPPHELSAAASPSIYGTAHSTLQSTPNTSASSSPFRTSSPLHHKNKSAINTSDSILDSSSTSNNNNNNSINNNNKGGGGGGKKVPPKPPPKPAGKRLSTSSLPGDAKKGKGFQDEGPDGTEV
ncbi:Leucine-rich repeat-containing protein 24 [Chionoecetes opilio]|uniref:Leucine-rich repeat-containing protein 24 n=1 Tax=Chionoecetes opilio TaxID=41210 RepID=A0A8J5CFV0_CHIOP|nr:Leucine-rich repeat-containing protein 24 [Chionoecetes opilio]